MSFVSVVTGVIANRGLVLMQQRRLNTMCPGMWETPGGKVEVGETSRAALKREMLEEVGVAVEPFETSETRLNLEHAAKITLFECTQLVGLPRPAEGQRIAWVDPEFALRRLQCVPSFYIFYQDIVQLAKWSSCSSPWGEIECLR